MGRKILPWRQNPDVLDRLPKVRKGMHYGKSNREIARELGVDEGTIRSDVKRIRELGIEYLAQDITTHRADVLREFEEIRQHAIHAAAFDESVERAVLFGEAAGTYTCPGDGSHAIKRELDPVSGAWVDREWCAEPHEAPAIIKRGKDGQGGATFRGGKAAALSVARAAAADKAKILGVAVDKVENLTPIPVRIYEREVAPSPPAAPAEEEPNP